MNHKIPLKRGLSDGDICHLSIWNNQTANSSDTPARNTFNDNNCFLIKPYDEKGIQQKLIADIIYKNTTDGIIIADLNGIIEKINPAGAKITGYNATKIIGNNLDSCLSVKHGAKFYSSIRNALYTNGIWRGETWARRKNSTSYPIKLTITQLRDQLGRSDRYIAIFSDQTKIKRGALVPKCTSCVA
jgi:PAS domain S-box-containing protein